MKKEYRKPEVTVVELADKLMSGDGNFPIGSIDHQEKGDVDASKDHTPGLFSNDDEKPLWDDTDK